MSRLVTCGWETGLLGEIGALGSNATNGYAFAVTSVARNGNHALSLQHNKPPGVGQFWGGTGTWCTIPIPEQPTEIYGRIAARVVTAPVDGNERFLQLLNGTNAHVVLFIDYITSAIGMSCGSGSIAWGGVLPTEWGGGCLEFYTKIDPSSGFFQLWDGGDLVINFTGRTQAGSYAPITHVQLCALVNSQTGNNAPRFDFDDLAINDTTGSVNNGRVGRGGIVPLFPTADTADKDFSRSSGAANWSLINTSPPRGDASYVQGSVVGDRDLYEVQELSGFGTIAVVGVAGVARTQGGAGAQLSATILINSTTSAKSAWTLIGTYAPFQTVWETNPETSAAWTGVAVNSLLAGATIG